MAMISLSQTDELDALMTKLCQKAKDQEPAGDSVNTNESDTQAPQSTGGDDAKPQENTIQSPIGAVYDENHLKAISGIVQQYPGLMEQVKTTANLASVQMKGWFDRQIGLQGGAPGMEDLESSKSKISRYLYSYIKSLQAARKEMTDQIAEQGLALQEQIDTIQLHNVPQEHRDAILSPSVDENQTLVRIGPEAQRALFEPNRMKEAGKGVLSGSYARQLARGAMGLTGIDALAGGGNLYASEQMRKQLQLYYGRSSAYLTPQGFAGMIATWDRGFDVKTPQYHPDGNAILWEMFKVWKEFFVSLYIQNIVGEDATPEEMISYRPGEGETSEDQNEQDLSKMGPEREGASENVAERLLELYMKDHTALDALYTKSLIESTGLDAADMIVQAVTTIIQNSATASELSAEVLGTSIADFLAERVPTVKRVLSELSQGYEPSRSNIPATQQGTPRGMEGYAMKSSKFKMARKAQSSQTSIQDIERDLEQSEAGNNLLDPDNIQEKLTGYKQKFQDKTDATAIISNADQKLESLLGDLTRFLAALGGLPRWALNEIFQMIDKAAAEDPEYKPFANRIKQAILSANGMQEELEQLE